MAAKKKAEPKPTPAEEVMTAYKNLRESARIEDMVESDPFNSGTDIKLSLYEVQEAFEILYNKLK